MLWDAATTNVHVLGRTQDGTAPTVYVVEPRSNSVFADAHLPSEPVAVVMDAQPDRPADDRNDLLAIASGGQMATVDTGNNQFAYRFPGVLLGSLMAVLHLPPGTLPVQPPHRGGDRRAASSSPTACCSPTRASP